ncbi:MAG: leucine-rich repeat domain-containing protein [Promethearchaeota archaeon]
MKFVIIIAFLFLIIQYCETDKSILEPLNCLSFQIIHAGNYVVLDASNIQFEDGTPVSWYQWESDPNNPVEIFVCPGEPISGVYKQIIGFTIPGVYKIKLTIYGGKELKRSKKKKGPYHFVVKVLPREESLFEDPNLEIIIRYALKKPTGLITKDELLLIDTLRATYFQQDKIKSLKGLEYCKNLKFLALSGQSISDISPIGYLINLEELIMNENRILSDISPLRNLINLRVLYLLSNNIKDISPLANLTNLEFLDLNFNPVENFKPLSNLVNLKYLYLAYHSEFALHSQVEDISPLSNLVNLELLWLTNYEISNIEPLKTLKNLKILYLEFNNVSDLEPLSNLTNLEELHLNFNKIKEIGPLRYLTNLKILGLFFNQIENIMPLVKNPGLRDGDVVAITQNPLSYESRNIYIPMLRNRGVIIL